MAANHSDSFIISKNHNTFRACNKNNMLKPNTCPTCNASYSAVEDDKTASNSNANEVFFTSEHFTDIDSDVSDTRDSLNTNDMQFSSSGSMLNTSFNSDLIEDTALEDEFLSSLSDNEFNPKNIYNDEPVPELDTVSLSSSETNVGNTNVDTNQSCAVLLCNENARKQFDVLFFINFPNDVTLRKTWWEICGRKDKFDPSIKICSIHFDPDDFKTYTVRRENQLYRQTILKNNEIVPTLYLLPHEFAKFTRKRKKNIKDSEITMESSENKKCVIQSCNKSFLKDGKSTLFFKFPLENKVMLKKWVDKIELPDWQPLETDKICSDHFEHYFVNKFNNVYELDQYAFPLVKPKNPFKIISKDSKKYEFNDHHFKNLEFKSLDDYVLLVSEKNKNNENEKSNSLHSLENDTNENKQIQLQNKIPETVTTLLNSTENNLMGTNALCPSTKCNNSSLEYMDVLDDLNNIEELQLKLDNSTSLTKQYLESFEREIAEEIEKNGNSSNNNNDLGYIYLNVFNNENMSEALPITNTNLAKTSMITELKNNENANDPGCVDLNMLNDDDIGNFLSLNKECVSKSINGTGEHDMTKIEEKTKNSDEKNISNITTVNNVSSTTFSSNLTNNWHIESININDFKATPKSIIRNEDLRECYGEMLPPYCNPDCQLICFYSIPGPQRKEVYNEFQILDNVTEQNCRIAELIELRSVKKGETFKNCVSYHLMIKNQKLKVCRTFFINTLGITEHRLDAILEPITYSWYFDRNIALKANVPKHVKVVTDESVSMTDFIKESSLLLNKDYNLFEPDSDTEVSLENISPEEYEEAISFVKEIPRVLCSNEMTSEMKKYYFEVSICVENMYKIYCETYARNKTPAFTELQFKKMYNQCMKTRLKMV